MNKKDLQIKQLEQYAEILALLTRDEFTIEVKRKQSFLLVDERCMKLDDDIQAILIDFYQQKAEELAANLIQDQHSEKEEDNDIQFN